MRRLSLRLKLALLYAVAFFVLGLVLVATPFLKVKETVQAGNPYAVPRQSLGAFPPLTTQVIAVVALAMISFGLGWLIAGRLLRPLRTITATARDISATNLHRRLNLGDRHDEFAELGETLDDLFERLAASFESQRHFVANASHELRTPLTAERTLLQVALADPGADAGTLRTACEEVLRLGAQTERLIDALLTLASSERGIEQRDPFDLAEIAGKIVHARHQEAERRGIHIRANLAAAPTAGDPSLAESLVANLVDNALRYNRPSGGSAEISTAPAAKRAVLSVRNTGPVIPPGEVDRLFQPFRRLGSQRIHNTGGHGLGLAIVSAIAGAHDAALTARAQPEGGLNIEVSFPTLRPTEHQASVNARSQGPGAGTSTRSGVS
jgi:signal transduction histidine kinase